MDALWGEDVKSEGTSRVAWEIEQVQDSCRLIVTHDQLRDGANEQLYGGWPMILIRDTLFRARMSGDDEWTALAGLGERIGVADLRELGALIKLVADDGAQVRSTLTARAASMRRAQLADEEGNAEERNQSMRLAQMLIALGFMLFVGYPAFVNIQF